MSMMLVTCSVSVNDRAHGILGVADGLRLLPGAVDRLPNLMPRCNARRSSSTEPLDLQIQLVLTLFRLKRSTDCLHTLIWASAMQATLDTRVVFDLHTCTL